MLWLIICLNVSISLVYRDMMSPCGCVSKYLIGSASILLNISFLILRIVPWLTLIMILLYRYEASTPTAQKHATLKIACANPEKSGSGVPTSGMIYSSISVCVNNVPWILANTPTNMHMTTMITCGVQFLSTYPISLLKSLPGFSILGLGPLA